MTFRELCGEALWAEAAACRDGVYAGPPPNPPLTYDQALRALALGGVYNDGAMSDAEYGQRVDAARARYTRLVFDNTPH